MAAEFPAVAGFRNIGSDSMRFIPELFSGKLIKKYYDRTVLGAVTNTDYEGEIKKFGDTVIIRGRPTMTIRDYKKGQTLVNEQPEAVSKTLVIDQGKYWSFVTDDVDDRQTDLKGYISDWAADAAAQLEIAIDTLVLAYMATKPHAKNTGSTAGVKSGAFTLGVTATPLTMTKANILDLIVDAGTVLDEQNVPVDGRFFTIPPRIAGLIKKSDLKDASLSGDAKSTIRTGVLGSIDRFTLIVSNLLAAGSDAAGTACLFGHKDATTFATQITERKMQDNPNGFGKLHRGLSVFGREVIKTEALGVAYLKV